MQFGCVSLRQDRRLIAQVSCWANQDKQQPDPNWPAFYCVSTSLPHPGWPCSRNLPLISSSSITFSIGRCLPLLSFLWKQSLVFQDCKRKERQTVNYRKKKKRLQNKNTGILDQNNAAIKFPMELVFWLPKRAVRYPICITVRSYLHYPPSLSDCLGNLIDKNSLN